MSGILDAIRKHIILQGPESINSDYQSPSLDIDGVEGVSSMLIKYDNGVGVNMTLSLEVSPNNIDWFLVENSEQLITDPSGNHYWRINDSGSSFIRVAIEVTAGSIDIQEIFFNGKRRH